METLEIVVMIVNFAYFAGIIFYILSIIEADFVLELDFKNFTCPENEDFIHCKYGF